MLVLVLVAIALSPLPRVMGLAVIRMSLLLAVMGILASGMSPVMGLVVIRMRCMPPVLRRTIDVRGVLVIPVPSVTVAQAMAPADAAVQEDQKRQEDKSDRSLAQQLHPMLEHAQPHSSRARG